jgi:signal-transduction protein with cAMP-binding, CBS, and nucleotidyltransferase domain
MRLGIVGTRHAVCIDRNDSVEAASCAMRMHEVDQVVVTATDQDAKTPIGIISARDIVTRVMALGLDSSVITAGDLLWSAPAQASVTDTVPEALERLSSAGASALPVVDSDGKLMGVVSLDDLLQAFASSESSGTHRLHR